MKRSVQSALRSPPSLRPLPSSFPSFPPSSSRRHAWTSAVPTPSSTTTILSTPTAALHFLKAAGDQGPPRRVTPPTLVNLRRRGSMVPCTAQDEARQEIKQHTADSWSANLPRFSLFLPAFSDSRFQLPPKFHCPLDSILRPLRCLRLRLSFRWNEVAHLELHAFFPSSLSLFPLPLPFATNALVRPQLHGTGLTALGRAQRSRKDERVPSGRRTRQGRGRKGKGRVVDAVLFLSMAKARHCNLKPVSRVELLKEPKERESGQSRGRFVGLLPLFLLCSHNSRSFIQNSYSDKPTPPVQCVDVSNSYRRPSSILDLRLANRVLRDGLTQRGATRGGQGASWEYGRTPDGTAQRCLHLLDFLADVPFVPPAAPTTHHQI
jgi:hypothetical protein